VTSRASAAARTSFNWSATPGLAGFRSTAIRDADRATSLSSSSRLGTRLP
jgi:hypothetical protein